MKSYKNFWRTHWSTHTHARTWNSSSCASKQCLLSIPSNTFALSYCVVHFECCYHCSSSQYVSVLILALPLKLNYCHSNSIHTHTLNFVISFSFCSLFDEIYFVLCAWLNKICLNFICCACHKFRAGCCVLFIHHFVRVILFAVSVFAVKQRERASPSIINQFLLWKFWIKIIGKNG